MEIKYDDKTANNILSLLDSYSKSFEDSILKNEKYQSDSLDSSLSLKYSSSKNHDSRNPYLLSKKINKEFNMLTRFISSEIRDEDEEILYDMMKSISDTPIIKTGYESLSEIINQSTSIFENKMSRLDSYLGDPEQTIYDLNDAFIDFKEKVSYVVEKYI